MKLIFLIYFTTLFNSWSLEIVRDTIPANGDSTITGSLTVTDDLTVDTNTLFVDSSNNRVGVGLTNPSWPLHIYDSSGATNGLINIEDTANNSYLRMVAAGDVSYLEQTTVGYVRINVTGTNTMTITTTQVGIGTDTPSYPLEAAGGAVAGNGAYVNTSDKRLKEDEENVTGACAILDEIQPLYYNWKSQVPVEYTTWANGFDEEGNNQVNKQPHGQKDIGFYAQDVEPHFPQAVNVSDSGRYNLQYEKFIPLLVACINEMRQ